MSATRRSFFRRAVAFAAAVVISPKLAFKRRAGLKRIPVWIEVYQRKSYRSPDYIKAMEKIVNDPNFKGFGDNDPDFKRFRES